MSNKPKAYNEELPDEDVMFYKLWSEFLKISELYKTFCASFNLMGQDLPKTKKEFELIASKIVIAMELIKEKYGDDCLVISLLNSIAHGEVDLSKKELDIIDLLGGKDRLASILAFTCVDERNHICMEKTYAVDDTGKYVCIKESNIGTVNNVSIWFNEAYGENGTPEDIISVLNQVIALEEHEYDNVFRAFLFFHNVFTCDNKLSFAMLAFIREKVRESYASSPVVLYREILSRCFDEMKKESSKDITSIEDAFYLAVGLTALDKNSIVVSIDCNSDISNVIKEVKRLVKINKKKSSSLNFPFHSNIQYKTYKKYIKVYNSVCKHMGKAPSLKERIPLKIWGEVAREIEEHDKGVDQDWEAILRRLQRDYQMAKLNIRAATLGGFPVKQDE